MNTRIYIDVDGVLNAFNMSKWFKLRSGAWESDYSSVIVRGYRITFNQELIDSLNEMNELENVEFVWLTTWTDNAAIDLAPAIGLKGDWRVLKTDDAAPVYPGDRGATGWWKFGAIQDDLVENPTDRFVWIDDELSSRFGAKEWAYESYPEVSLLISPDDSEGLRPDEVCAIIDFIDGEQVFV